MDSFFLTLTINGSDLPTLNDKQMPSVTTMTEWTMGDGMRWWKSKKFSKWLYLEWTPTVQYWCTYQSRSRIRCKPHFPSNTPLVKYWTWYPFLTGLVRDSVSQLSVLYFNTSKSGSRVVPCPTSPLHSLVIVVLLRRGPSPYEKTGTKT